MWVYVSVSAYTVGPGVKFGVHIRISTYKNINT